MTTVSKSVTKICVTDLVAFLLVYLIPTLSHLVAFPLYLVDPMRIVLLGTLLCTKNWKNALFMAVTLPIFSFLVSAHPVFPKCLLMSGELAINVLLFTAISKNFTRFIGLSAFASIIVSKAIYYAVEFLFISLGILSLSIVSSELMIQVLVAVTVSIIFSLTYQMTNKNVSK